MRKYFILLGLILAFNFSNAQLLNEVDVVVAQYPQRFSEAKELADRVNNDFHTEKDKARAIFAWLAMNVKYDIKGHYKKKRRKRIKYDSKVEKAKKLRKQRIKIESKALTSNLALAEGYTTVYKTVCDLCGVYGYIIKGTAKLRTFDIGKQPRMQNHSWNVVQIGKDWFFVDATLAAGTVDFKEKTYQHGYNTSYFFTPHEKFFLKHFPKDQNWLLVEKTAMDFASLPLFHSEYFRSGFELVEPQNGMLDLKSQDSIQFKLKAPVNVEDLTYAYSLDKESTPITIENKEDEYSFIIPFLVKRRGYLTIYRKTKPFLTYKISAY